MSRIPEENKSRPEVPKWSPKRAFALHWNVAFAQAVLALFWYVGFARQPRMYSEPKPFFLEKSAFGFPTLPVSACVFPGFGKRGEVWKSGFAAG